MYLPEWFVIVVVIFILVLLVRIAQLSNHIEELRDCVAKLEEGPEDANELQDKNDVDSGGD
jgi:hypothetical protein